MPKALHGAKKDVVRFITNLTACELLRLNKTLIGSKEGHH